MLLLCRLLHHVFFLSNSAFVAARFGTSLAIFFRNSIFEIPKWQHPFVRGNKKFRPCPLRNDVN
jgi:hypothetical protein